MTKKIHLVGAAATLLFLSTAYHVLHAVNRNDEILDGIRRNLVATNKDREFFKARRTEFRIRQRRKAKTDRQPVQVCGRDAPFFVPTDDLQVIQEYAQCPNKEFTNQDTILLIEGYKTFGRTGNNLIEFLHALQFARENDATVGIMKNSWAMNVIFSMWYSDEGDGWKKKMEEAFCVKIISDTSELSRYKNVIQMDTRDLFMYRTRTKITDYVRFQGYNIRNLFRSYNQQGERDMCSVVDALFGKDRSNVKYSVVHSRSLEGAPGVQLLGRISKNSGCDPLGALDMEPDYVKTILGPLGMLEHPIIFITDHQRPEILERLLADPDIGPQIRLVPEEASWVGGDMTVAIVSDVFIGNPASTFSGFIAKSRLALGFGNNYLFRRKNAYGEWVDVCTERCIFNKRIMNAMA